MRPAAALVPLLLIGLLVASAALAQESGGSIAGRIVGPGNTPIAGALVSVRGAPLPQGRTALSDSRGVYRFAALPVGDYRLGIASLGHRPVRVNGVSVRLGRTTSVDETHLVPMPVEVAELVVTASRPLIDPVDPTVGANLPAETFSSLPTGRGFRSIAALAPMAIESHLPGDEANISGGSGPETAWFIDGVNMTDLYAGATSANLPYNFVEEIRVRSAGYAAEFGRTMGGAVDVITRSGGNAWRGQVFAFMTGAALSADPRFSGTATTSETFAEYDAGASIGGPIVRDRLWFFGAYNPSVRREQFLLSGLRPPTDRRTTHLLAAKLTWQPAPRTLIHFTALGDPARGTTVFQSTPWDSVGGLGPVLAEERDGGLAISLAGRHEISRTLTLEASAATMNRRSEVLPGTDAGFAEPIYVDLRTNSVEGGFGGLLRTSGRRTSGRVSATLSLPGHSVKIGGEYEDNFLDYESDYGGTPNTQGGIARLDDVTWDWYREHRAAKLHNRVPTAYVQDEWRLSPRLALNLGIRWEAQLLVAADGQVAQKIMDQWQPRAGFVFEPDPRGRQRVFGSYGRFYEQLPLNVMTFYGNAGGYSYALYPQDPRVDTTGGQVETVPFAPAIEPRRDLKGQGVDQFGLGYERLVGKGVRAGIQLLHRRLRHAVEDAFNPDSGYGMLGNPGRANLDFTPKAERKYTAMTLVLEKPEGFRSAWQLSYTLARATGNYEGLYEYQYGQPFANTGGVFDTPEQYPNSSGLLSSDRTHTLKFNGSYRFDYGMTVGVVARLLSGVARNEFGATTTGYDRFLVPRGSNGRSPVTHDVNLRFAYQLPVRAGARIRPRVQMDVLHLTNGRQAVMMDDVRFTYVDESGQQAGSNPGFGTGRFFQPPRSVRVGMIIDY